MEDKNISRRSAFQAGLTVGIGGLLGRSQVLGQEFANSRQVPGGQRPRGIVFLVSDGMSHGVLPLAEAFSQQVRRKSTAWWQLLANAEAAHGLMDTPSSDSLVTDSAAASTAWSAGMRVPNGQICVDANGKNAESIGETLAGQGVRMGLVTTAKVTHATPAGFATNSVNRNDEAFIAPQFLDRAEILLGGGNKFFDPNHRRDGKDLYQQYLKGGYQVVNDRESLLASKANKLLGVFSDDHLPYSIDRHQSKKLQAIVPTLAEMTEVALDRLLPGSKPFLLQVEGARIDHAAHANDIGAILHDQIAFDDAVATALACTAAHPDLLVVVTSDHGNANPALNGTGAGYRKTNESFSRIALCSQSHAQFLAQGRAQKENVAVWQRRFKKAFGFHPEKEEAEVILDSIAGRDIVEWHHQQDNPMGLMGQIIGNHTGTGWTGVSHTADPTQITSLGPGAGRFGGLVRNDDVRDHLLELLLG